MMNTRAIRKLAAAVKELRDQLPRVELLPRDVLDILWLARLMGPGAEVAERRDAAPAEQRMQVPSSKPAVPAIPAARPRIPEPSGRRVLKTREEKLPVEADLHPDTPRQKRGGGRMSTLPLRTPGAQALGHTLPLARALRPLRKRVESRTTFVFDEMATAEQSAELRASIPVFRPTSAGWLDLAIVTDTGGSMHFWSQTVEELRGLLERHSAFGSVRGWRITEEETGALSLRTWSARSQPSHRNELLDPGGRQLIVVISDCVSPCWSDGRMGALLRGWVSHGPLALFQLLPSRLWARTGLRHARFTTFRATAPGVPNALLIGPDDDRRATDVLKIPIATLDRTSLSSWARVVAGVGGASVRGVLLPSAVPHEVSRERARRVEVVQKASPAERVERFDQTASEEAQRMARLLASAHFPLTPPIMRLIQHAVMPGSSSSVIAEVLLGGLMKRLPAQDSDPEVTEYVFTEEEVRHRLLDSASAPDVLRVLRTNVSNFIGREFGSVVDFAALLADPGALGELRIGKEEEPFARVGVSILRRLGGGYGELADRIERSIEGQFAESPAFRLESIAEWGRPGHPRRPRFELAEYLNSEDLPRDAASAIGSLQRWGLPAVVLACIAAAEAVTGDDDAEGQNVLAIARTALAAQTPASVRSIDARLRSDRSAASKAARVAATAFRRDVPPARPTLAAAADCAVACVREAGGDDARILDAIVVALLDDLAGEVSVIPDRVQDHGWVVVAGEGSYALDRALALTAVALGRELAKSGFRLVSGGWAGVDHVTAREFVIELELRGGSVEGSLLHVIQSDRPDFDYGPSQRVGHNWIDAVLSDVLLPGIRVAAVITIGGGVTVAELIRRADNARIPAIPLPWTGGTSAAAAQGREYRFGRRGVLKGREVHSAPDADLLVGRVVRMLLIATDRQAAAKWSDYTNLIYTLYRSATQPPLEWRAPRMHTWVSNLGRDGAVDLRVPFDELFSALESHAVAFPEWVASDFLQLCEFERGAFRPDTDVVTRFAALVRRHAHDAAMPGLTRRFQALASPLPRWPMDLLPAAARAFFEHFENLDRWTKTTIGMDADECFFRASIPLKAYQSADAYVTSEPTPEVERHASELRQVLGDLTPRREYVRRFADSDDDAARVIAYALMHLYDLGIGPVELVDRIEDEARDSRTETRPFRQLLHATARVCTWFDASGSRIVARALAAAKERIARRPQEDDQRDIGQRIQALLTVQLASAAQANARIDQEAVAYARRRHAASTQDSIPSGVRELTFSASEVEHLFRGGNDAQRRLALRLATETEGRTPFEAVRQALQRPHSQAEALLAIIAADLLAERLTHSQLNSALEKVVALRTMFAEQRGSSAYLGEVLERLRLQRDSADQVRFAPIAILGSDPSGGALRDFIRELGERLAISELGVITANATFGVWLWEGYRRRSTDMQSFLVLRRAVDPRPVGEGLPCRTVDGDMPELREELIRRAKGAVLIGGGNGAFKEYEMARRNGIPIVSIEAAGGAAAEVSSATLTRLEALGIAVGSIRDAPLTMRLASATATIVTAAVLRNDESRKVSVGERRRAGSLDVAQLISAIRVTTTASEGTLHRARILIEALSGGRIVWKRSVNALRRYDKHVQGLRPAFARNPYVAELVSRATFAVALVELFAIEELQGVIRKAAAYDRLSTAPPEVLHALQRSLENATLAAGRPRELAARLREEIAFRITTL